MTGPFSPSSFATGALVGTVLVGAWFSLKDSPLSFLPSSRSISAVKNASAESDIVSVADQRAGETVVIEKVTAPAPTWIAVHEVNGGLLGNALGAARVGTTRADVEVSLLRSTLPDRQYAVKLYRDDNDGAFDLAKNSVYIDFDTSAPVVAYFKTTE